MQKNKEIINFDEIIDYIKMLNSENNYSTSDIHNNNVSLDSKSINSVYEKISNIISLLKKSLRQARSIYLSTIILPVIL